jgi:hypothetical protein
VSDAWDRELVESHLMLLADIAANTARSRSSSRRTMGKRRKKTDFTEQRERIREVRELVERSRKLREQREAEERKKTG